MPEVELPDDTDHPHSGVRGGRLRAATFGATDGPMVRAGIGAAHPAGSAIGTVVR